MEGRTGEVASEEIVAEEYWAKKGDVDLFVFRKFAPEFRKHDRSKVLFLVHGSSQSARTAYDLDAGDLGEYSVMNVFARLGWDVWTMDHEGYGRSSRTDGFSFIHDSVDDLNAGMQVLDRVAGVQACAFFGTSSGALRAAAFQNRFPQRVTRLALSAFPWKGEQAPSLVKRRQRLDEWQAVNRRMVDAEYYRTMLTRDVVGLTDPALGETVAENELRNGGDSVPNGSYIDMCINLPLVDPEKVTCPVLMIRGDHDGITTDEDNLEFFSRISCRDKRLVMMSGQAHNITYGVNRHRFWQTLESFLEYPERCDDLNDR